MLVKSFSAAVNGLDVNTVTVEVSMSRGVQFHLTGLADTAVKESYDRIKAAMVNNGFKMPVMDITVNLSPADIKKEGSGYDLPVAIGILAASGKVDSCATEPVHAGGRVEPRRTPAAHSWCPAHRHLCP
jgi:Predicted ATPase with chaperone activity